MKKLLSLGLAAMLAFGLATTSFAAEAGSDTSEAGTGSSTATVTDQETVTIHKVYKLVGAGSSPAETFTLEQVGDGTVTDGEATSAPHLGTITGAAYAEGAATANGTTGDITVKLPQYTSVGVYEYTLKEDSSAQTAGVDYYANNIKLVVTVVNGENGKLRIAAVHTESGDAKKSDNFPNTYSAGTLNVSKTVTGNLGDENKYFEFKVTLTGVDGKNYRDSYTVTGGSNAANPSVIKIGEETTFLLKHGETIHIANLPYDVTYTVTETAADGYTTTKTGDTGTINAADQTAAFTNNKTGEIDMGVTLNNMPYVLVLAVLAAGVAVFVIRKRRED